MSLDDDMEIGVSGDDDIAGLTTEKLRAAQGRAARVKPAIASTKRHSMEFRFEGEGKW